MFSNISCRAGLVVMNSFSFCLTRKVFLSPSVLNDKCDGQNILSWEFFPFTLWICHTLPFGLKNFCWSLLIVIWGPLFITVNVLLAAYKIFSLSASSDILVTVCFSVGLSGFIFLGMWLAGPGSLFPFPGSGNFQALFFQMDIFLRLFCGAPIVWVLLTWCCL